MPDAPLCARLADAAATAALGKALAEALLEIASLIESCGVSIYLRGDLGSGKTTLVRALLRRAGVAGPVKSPTFSLLEPYAVSRLQYYHFDFYRFKSPEEFPEGGFEEYFGPGAVCLVEWPERAGAFLPPADLLLHLRVQGAGRQASVQANTEIGRKCLDRLRTSGAAASAGA